MYFEKNNVNAFSGLHSVKKGIARSS